MHGELLLLLCSSCRPSHLPFARLEPPRRWPLCRRGSESLQKKRKKQMRESDLRGSTSSQAVGEFFALTFFLMHLASFLCLDHFHHLFFQKTSSAAVSRKKTLDNGSLRHHCRLQHQPPSPDRDARRRQAHEQAARSVSFFRWREGEREREQEVESGEEAFLRPSMKKRVGKRSPYLPLSDIRKLKIYPASGSRCSMASPSRSTPRSGTDSG